MLRISSLSYGSSRYRVEPSELRPLPEEFDFDNPEECARLIFAVMSNASGGHTLSDCTLRYNKRLQRANLTASGCHVYYSDDRKLSMDEAFCYHRMEDTVTLQLGYVYSDQYEGGWQRARWGTPG